MSEFSRLRSKIISRTYFNFNLKDYIKTKLCLKNRKAQLRSKNYERALMMLEKDSNMVTILKRIRLLV